MKKLGNFLLIILFPLGILYCIGKNLFSGSAVSFAGGVFLTVAGVGLGIWLMNPNFYIELYNMVVSWLPLL